MRGDHLRTHGLSKHPLYKRWQSMLQRCYYPKHVAFWRYGGAGISVCERWHSFPQFLEDMGEAPSGMSLERIDNTKGYSPENCRWATRIEQGRNTTTNRLITFDGRTQCLKAWANEIGITVPSLRNRLDRWPIESAMSKQIFTRHTSPIKETA